MKYQLYCESMIRKGDCLNCSRYHNGMDCKNHPAVSVKMDIEVFERRRANAMALLGVTSDSFVQGYLVGLNQNYFKSLDIKIHIMLLEGLNDSDKKRNQYSQGYLTGCKGVLMRLIEKGCDDYGNRNKAILKHEHRNKPQIYGNC